MATNETPLYGLALTGGRSTRMGRDKATLIYDLQPQLERIMALLEAACARSFVSLRADQSDALRDRWPGIVDAQHDIGPIAGIAAAQATYPTVAWLVVACDLPLLNSATLQQLIAARDSTHDVVAFTTEEHLESLCALWQPSSCHHVQTAVQHQQYSVMKALQRMNTRLLTPDDPTALRNINTLDDYRLVTAN
jgi:molybdenum cofactor guanylyltransferase